jgi:hypothetical protein
MATNQHAPNTPSVFPPPERVAANAHVKSMAEYQALYDASIADPVGLLFSVSLVMQQRLVHDWTVHTDNVMLHHRPQGLSSLIELNLRSLRAVTRLS